MSKSLDLKVVNLVADKATPLERTKVAVSALPVSAWVRMDASWYVITFMTRHVAEGVEEVLVVNMRGEDVFIRRDRLFWWGDIRLHSRTELFEPYLVLREEEEAEKYEAGVAR